jgi:cytosine/adenosine deaminase-related metal-dependent hydrolase
VIRDGAVAMAGGRIVAVGPSAELAATVTAREVVDARGFVATPGFVNAHVHLTETLLRNFLPEALPFDEGLNQWVIPLYQATRRKSRRLPPAWPCSPCSRPGRPRSWKPAR